MQKMRTASGGRIDRSRTISFTFNGENLIGHPGDTLASALLANNVAAVNASETLGRRRGIAGAWADQPAAMVRLRRDGRDGAPQSASLVELYQGLQAGSVKAPSALPLGRFSLRSLLGAAAGDGAATSPGPDRGGESVLDDGGAVDRLHMHCDVLVVGAGPAGLSAALAAARMGTRVVLADQLPLLGGALLAEPVDSVAAKWLGAARDELRALSNVTILMRTRAAASSEAGLFHLLERVSAHQPARTPNQPYERAITLHCGQTVLATGAAERMIGFGNNDLPGVMMAGAARHYLNGYGVRPGQQAVVFTTNDRGYDAAFDLKSAGAAVTIVDPRGHAGAEILAQAGNLGIAVLPGQVVVEARGRERVNQVIVAGYDANSRQALAEWQALKVDLLCVSSGYDPRILLPCQLGAVAEWSDGLAAYVATCAGDDIRLAGAVAGSFFTADCVRDGLIAGKQAGDRQRGSGDPGGIRLPRALAEMPVAAPSLPLFDVAPPPDWRAKKRFVDIAADITVDDIAVGAPLASDAAPDCPNVLAAAAHAGHRGTGMSEALVAAGFPPPVAVPPAFRSAEPVPRRRSPLHRAQSAAGAVFVDRGAWRLAWAYQQSDSAAGRPSQRPPASEADLADDVRREAHMVRQTAGIADISALGKLSVQGPDAAEFLGRAFVDDMASLGVGTARRCVMLRADGSVLDIGTAARLSLTEYFITTCANRFTAVAAHLAQLLDAAADLPRVRIDDVSDQYAGIVVAGPQAQGLLGTVVGGTDFDDGALPQGGSRARAARDLPLRVQRLSSSGERAYELFTSAGFGEELWERLAVAGRRLGAVRYGAGAIDVLRIEKGLAAEPELAAAESLVAGGQVARHLGLRDLGLAAKARPSGGYVGANAAPPAADKALERWQLAGVVPVDRRQQFRAGAEIGLPEGAHDHSSGTRTIGRVTSVAFSPQLGHCIALCLVAGAQAKPGTRLRIAGAAGSATDVEIARPCFFDPKGERYNA